MNIAFYLLPKDEVKFLNPEATVRQALEKLSYHKYTSVPLVSEEGHYIGTLTEGDLLWKLREALETSYDEVIKTKLKNVPQRVNNISVSINSNMEDLITLSTDQNFIPVTDDNGYFIGIIRRRDIIKYCANLIWNKEVAKD
ncbi:CBS domain-containing protein [Fictibacillus barbaricus]|jgi:CBS domain-containing protein|uniref:CBS domain-containing protein n=1 Tax=Fictibacillus barbaricus TaxID=182136 RepID=A0ABU1TXC6_9BACL|nr:CBS domain-containing protein [Fictibacillus barbaricus]MDR7071876.1 CBS domain-containing protein [Fictibacillus barbaricus]